MSILIDIIVPVFGLLALGYLCARVRMLDEPGIRGISTFVFNLAIPVMLFRRVATSTLPPEVPWNFLLTYYLGAAFLFLAAMALARFAFHREGQGLAIFGMGASYSNVVLLGIPLVMTTFGDSASLPLLMIVSTHAALMFFLTTAIAELLGGAEGELRHLPWQTARVLLRNPIVVGLLAGLACNLADVELSAALDSLAGSLGAAALPCAVFSVGASLSLYPVRGELAEAFTLVAIKTVVHPLLVWFLATRVFALASDWAAVAVLLAGAPVGVNTYLFAQRYRVLVTPSAAAITISTGCSVVTLSVLLYLLGVR